MELHFRLVELWAIPLTLLAWAAFLAALYWLLEFTHCVRAWRALEAERDRIDAEHERRQRARKQLWERLQ